MKKFILIVFVLGLFACNKKTNQKSVENQQQKTEQSIDEKNNLKQENALQEFVHRSNDGVMKIWVKLDFDTFKPIELKFQDKNSNEIVDLKILDEFTTDDKYTVENTQTTEKYQFNKDFTMAAVMYKDGKEYIFNRETICYSKDGKVLTTSDGPAYLPFFYAENEKETPKEIKIPEVYPAVQHPKYPNDTYFKGALPNGKKVDIICHTPDDRNPVTKITLIVDGKEILFEEKKTNN